MDRVEGLVRRERAGERVEYLFFWGHRGRADGRVSVSCFSQWWGAGFVVGGERFATAEHFMMVGKARLFGDEEVAQAILGEADPAVVKGLGRAVRGFDAQVWDAAAFDVVVQGNLAKFMQHEELGEFLVGTKDAVLVEASPVDAVWGIGLAADDPRAASAATWQGRNLLGFALMEVRRRLVL